MMQRTCSLSLTVLTGTILMSMQPEIATEAAHQANTAVGSKQIVQTQSVEITAVQVEETVTGLTIRLEASGELTLPATSITGNAVIADVSNAVLRLADSNDFFASEPVAEIDRIDVINLPNNRVQIVITGTDAAPTLEVSAGESSLVINVTPADSAVEIPGDDSLRIVVTGEEDTGYFTPDASTATRTDTPLRDIPQSIQVIPRQVIEDQQAIGLEEVLENSAGVSSLGNDSGRGLNLAIRGFTGAPILRDGFLLLGPSSSDAAEPEVANLEQVEVLRGPASVLYGQAQPGGIINLATKKPLSEPYYNLQLQGGTEGFISPSLDLSGPLTEDGRLLYRLNTLYRREESFRDFDNDLERFFIAPTLTWLISDRTDLTVNLEYVDDHEPLDTGTFAFGEGIADVPPSRVFNDPDSQIKQDFLSAGYTLEHRFNDNWQLRNRFRYTSSSFDYSVVPFPLFLNESTGITNRAFLQQSGDTDTYSLYTNIQGQFDTGSLKHTLLFGVDLARSENDTLGGVDFANFSPINIFEDTVDVPFPAEESLFTTIDRTITVEQLGIYLQDQIDILDNLILVAGLRYDLISQETIQNLSDTEISEDDSALTPRIGIVYQPIEPISLYVNYSRSFAPNFSATNSDGELLDSEEGEGFEVGLRGEIIEDRLAATLAYFDITKQNVATQDPTDPFSSVATGEQRSRGVDFNLTGEILPGWNIIASYAYIDAEVTEDNTDIVGNRLIAIPEHSASLWTTYELQSGDLQGLGFGLGFSVVGQREGDLDNSFRADSYFLTNAAFFYKRNDWQVRLNVDNLFNINYIESVNGARAFGNDWGDPLAVRASVEYTF